MINTNTKEYWEKRFKTGNWSKAGRRQTEEYALANIQYVSENDNFDGTILDFGCALGDAIPVYKAKYPLAKVCGYDISPYAVRYCRYKYSKSAEFYTGELNEIPYSEIIIASHVMEHISNDKLLVKYLLKKCKELYVFVPYLESPLYHEHVNRYDENYYTDLSPASIRIFEVSYKRRNSIREIVSQMKRSRFSMVTKFMRPIIMFRFHGV